MSFFKRDNKELEGQVNTLEEKLEEVVKKLGMARKTYLSVISLMWDGPDKDPEHFGEPYASKERLENIENKISAILEHLGQEYYEREVRESNGQERKYTERGLQDRQYHCEYCNEKFDQEKGLNIHVGRVHN